MIVRVNLRGCARCDGDVHMGMMFTPLTMPVVEKGEVIATHWATCPTNHEPILMLVSEDTGKLA